jgi:hypothetical protein
MHILSILLQLYKKFKGQLYYTLVVIKRLSAFRTREDPRPTSEFVAACPCPDGFMQDETQVGG